MSINKVSNEDLETIQDETASAGATSAYGASALADTTRKASYEVLTRAKCLEKVVFDNLPLNPFRMVG